jgi:hypothetical protein
LGGFARIFFEPMFKNSNKIKKNPCKSAQSA